MFQEAYYTTGRLALGAFAQAMLSMDIYRHTPLPDGPKIFAANHPTTTDPVLMTLFAREPIHILITGMCFKIPIVGRSLRLAGHIPVRAGHGHESLDEAVQLLKDGKTVGIFPEGALSPLDGGLYKPHTGLARMALMTGAPVIPVGIHLQHENITFVNTTVDGDTETARLYLHGPYAVTIGEPLVFTGDVEDRDYVKRISEQVMRCITQLAQESAQRLADRQSTHHPTGFRPFHTPARLSDMINK